MPKNRMRIRSMAAYSTTRYPISAPALSSSGVGVRSKRRRITPQAGRALEVLGHAIEYLTDEFVQQGRPFTASDGQLRAVQLLMALNRQVYYECSEVPTLGDRLRRLLHLDAPAPRGGTTLP
jgi:hypothetical protein